MSDQSSPPAQSNSLKAPRLWASRLRLPKRLREPPPRHPRQFHSREERTRSAPPTQETLLIRHRRQARSQWSSLALPPDCASCRSLHAASPIHGTLLVHLADRSWPQEPPEHSRF